MINMLMGISEAVLNNVLFCHQDDATWPLSEDGNVKKKFDQIFDSSKFDHAVDHLTKSIKKRVAGLKGLQRELVYVKDMRDTAKLKRNMLRDKEESLRILDRETHDLNRRYKPLKVKLNEILSLEQNIFYLQKMKSEKENQLSSNRNYQADLHGLLLSQFEGSDEELDQEIENFLARVQQKQNELKRVEKKMHEDSDQLKITLDEEQRKKVSLAELRQQIKSYEAKIEERHASAASLLRQFMVVPKETFEENCSEIARSFDRRKATLADTEKNYAKYEVVKEQLLEAAQNKLLTIRGIETVKGQEKKAVFDEHRIIENQLESLSASDKEFMNFERKIKQVQTEIDKIRTSFNEDVIFRTIEKNKKRIRALKDNLVELESDMKTIIINAMVEKEIEHHQADKLVKEKAICKIRNQHRNDFIMLFETVPTEDIRTEVENLRKKHMNILNSHQESLSEMVKKSSDLNALLSVEKIKMNNLRSELNAGRQAIEKYCTGDEFESKRTSVMEENLCLQREKGTVNAFELIYEEYVNTLIENKCCPVCNTDFSVKQAAVNNVVADLQRKIENLPARMRSVASRLEKNEKLHNELMLLTPVYLKITKNEKDLKAIEKSVATLEMKYTQISMDQITVKNEIEQHQKKLEICTQLAPNAALMDQYMGDIASAISAATALQGKLTQLVSKRTKFETERLIHETKEEISNILNENEQLVKKMTMNQKRLHDYSTEKEKLNDAQLKLRRLVQDKPQLLLKQTDLQKKIIDLDQTLEELENKSLIALADVGEAKANLEAAKRENVGSLNDLRKSIQMHQGSYQTIEKLSEEIKRIDKNQLSSKIQQVEDDLVSLQETRQQIEVQSRKLNIQRDLLKDELRDQDSMKNSLQNNLKLRDLDKKAGKLQEQIDSINCEIGDKNYGSMEVEKVLLQKEINAVITEIAKIDGQITSLKETIEDITNELGLCKQDPIQIYLAKLAEIKFEKALIEDLRQITESISVGICKYHREQLLSINLRLRELWGIVYKGHDIDYIQIESGETQISSSRRQYSYCLVQKKGDVFMPMRGKCSSGQKILACLLVRIVLAEHFSAQCGIFALDEPTTNLDRENIRSLSQAIAALVNNHRSEKNFQFLIITHDEEFLDALREVDAVREFYRVSRNYHGNTIIKKEEI